MASLPASDLSGLPPVPPRRVRHPLGLPAGSVRALLALMVLGVLWVLALKARDAEGRVPVLYIYLQSVMILIIAHYFAVRTHEVRHPGESLPLGLPRGTVRVILLAGYIGLVGWVVYHQTEFEQPAAGHVVLPLILLAGFLAGFVLGRLGRWLGGGPSAGWLQDMQAWVALLGTIGLVVVVVLRLFILPNLQQDLRFDLTTAEMVVATVIAFYFGARS